MLRYPRLPHTMFTDTLLAGEKSSRGNKCSQVFATSYAFTRAYGMKVKSQAHEALSVFLKNEGVPLVMVMDGSKEQLLGEFRRKLKEANCHQSQIEPYFPWMNACEAQIREIKRGSSRKMLRMGSPKCLWDYSLELECLIQSATAHDLYDLDGQTPHSKLFGEPADISAICEFGWYDWVMFYDSPDHTFPDPKFELGRWLGPARDVGAALTYHILKPNGEVIPRSTVRHLSAEELDDPVMQQKMKDFVANIDEQLGIACTESDFPPDALTPVFDYYEDDDDGLIGSADTEETPTPEAGDYYLNASVMLPHGGTLARGRVVRRKRDREGNPIGRANANPILDTRSYEVEFEDGDVSELTANTIAESMYAMCDEDGHQILIFDEICDYRRSTTALQRDEQLFTDSRGKRQMVKSVKGWQLCVQ